MWQARPQIRAERRRQRLGHVPQHLGQGGWGKKDITSTPAGLTVLHTDDGCRLTNAKEIAQQATKYYTQLFAPEITDDSEETGYGMTMRQMLEQEYDLWDDNITTSADMVRIRSHGAMPAE